MTDFSPKNGSKLGANRPPTTSTENDKLGPTRRRPTSNRSERFAGIEECYPCIVLSEYFFYLGLGEDHASGGERVRFGSRIGENPGSILARCGAAGARIENVASLNRQA